MNKHLTLMLCGLVVGLVITVLWLGSENARQREEIASLDANLNATQSALASAQLEFTRKQEQVTVLRLKIAQARESFNRISYKVLPGIRGQWRVHFNPEKDIQEEMQAGKALDAEIETLEKVSNER